MPINVEFIYDPACPNVDDARRVLRQALDSVGLEENWQEWDRANPESPDHSRHYGSPTILVNGKDVVGQQPNTGQNCCRVYAKPGGGFQGVPPLDAVITALRGQPATRSGWEAIFGAVPGIAAALLPVGTCPACWPLYAGLLSSLGLGFLLYATYLLPLTAGLLLFSLGTMVYRAKTRRGYGPFALGLLAATGILVGKFALASDLVFYSGAVLFVVAALWNAWPKTKTTASCCDSCVPQE